MHTEEQDADSGKGAVEQDKPDQPDNTSLSGQLPHRPESKLIGGNDSDFPEPGQNPEHSGEPQEQRMNAQEDSAKKAEQEAEDINPEGANQDQDPGQRQKQNQADKKDDDLAA
jgi:hypothetical protein